jgi:hypothetical protein
MGDYSPYYMPIYSRADSLYNVGGNMPTGHSTWVGGYLSFSDPSLIRALYPLPFTLYPFNSRGPPTILKGIIVGARLEKNGQIIVGVGSFLIKLTNRCAH